LVWDF
jgi:hypothetical protein